MAILNDGPNGPIRGKFGSVFAYVLNGQNIVRGARKPRTTPPSEAELLNQKKTKVTNDFLTYLFPIVKYGYKNLLIDHPTKNAANLAQSHVRKECMAIDTNNEPYVRVELFKPLRGSLFTPENGQMELVDGKLYITWTPPTVNNSQDWVKLNVVVLNPEEVADMRVAIVPARLGEYCLESELLGRLRKGLHIYIGFEDSYTGKLSDSVYLGKID
ncbi:MAG: hypothetical protein LBE37_12385 [Sphingobacterium sp.]|nr:hypothetical protein [Sphingobacterium sp.]